LKAEAPLERIAAIHEQLFGDDVAAAVRTGRKKLLAIGLVVTHHRLRLMS
jgi:hypothetical protein